MWGRYVLISERDEQDSRNLHRNFSRPITRILLVLIFVQETCVCVRCNGDISRNDGLGMVSVCETRCVERRRQIKQRAISSLGWERELASRERTSNTLLTVRRTLRRRRHPTDLGKTSCSRRALIWASPNAASASTTGAGQRLSDWICLNTLKTV